MQIQWNAFINIHTVFGFESAHLQKLYDDALALCFSCWSIGSLQTLVRCAQWCCCFIFCVCDFFSLSFVLFSLALALYLSYVHSRPSLFFRCPESPVCENAMCIIQLKSHLEMYFGLKCSGIGTRWSSAQPKGNTGSIEWVCDRERKMRFEWKISCFHSLMCHNKRCSSRMHIILPSSSSSSMWHRTTSTSSIATFIVACVYVWCIFKIGLCVNYVCTRLEIIECK